MRRGLLPCVALLLAVAALQARLAGAAPVLQLTEDDDHETIERWAAEYERLVLLWTDGSGCCGGSECAAAESALAEAAKTVAKEGPSGAFYGKVAFAFVRLDQHRWLGQFFHVPTKVPAFHIFRNGKVVEFSARFFSGDEILSYLEGTAESVLTVNTYDQLKELLSTLDRRLFPTTSPSPSAVSAERIAPRRRT